MWARGLDDRPSTLTFTPPAGASWQVATQLHRGSGPLELTAPNLAYLMDSPVEFGPLAIRQFSVGSRTFRFAAHHRGSDGELDDFVKDVEKIVRQEGLVFGEFPEFEPGFYTFLADYLPYANGDGMEHRNSTVMTATGSIRNSRRGLLETVAHEFFHAWNVERIRPRSLEPFDLERANMSGELWLAEGFTQYYGSLSLHRAGIADLRATSEALTEFVEAAVVGPGRAVRSAEDMSRMAVFIDGGTPVDRTNWPTTYTLVLSVWRRHRARARSHAARSLGQPRHARRFHAGHVARPRQAWRRPRRRRRPPVHVGRRRSAAGGSQRRRGRSPPISSIDSFVAATSPTTRRCSLARGSRSARAARDGPGGATSGSSREAAVC